MTPERYSATVLGAREGEQFLAVGDDVPLRLNPRHGIDRLVGKTESLPDLVSVTASGLHRVREVKYKLERGLVLKAAAQLEAGVAFLLSTFPAARIDRAEIVVPLRGRRLKPAEWQFLGESLGGERYVLVVDGQAVRVRTQGQEWRVTVVVL